MYGAICVSLFVGALNVNENMFPITCRIDYFISVQDILSFKSANDEL